MTAKLALVGQARGRTLGGLRRSGTPLAICFFGRLSPTSCPPLHPDQLADFSSDFVTPDPPRRSPDTLIRAPPALDSALAPISRPPKTTLRHLHPSGSFLKSSAHSRAVVDSSDSLALIGHQSARRVAPFSHRRPTIRPQPTRKARDDSPELHRLPRARTLRLHRLRRLHLGLRPSAKNLRDARKLLFRRWT